MSYPEPQPVDRQIEGVLSGMEPRNNGFMRFSIQEDGLQYPTRCDTRHKEVIDAALGLMGQRIAAQIRETPSTKINPKSGTVYGPSRWLNAVAPAGYAPGVTPTVTPQEAPRAAVAPQGVQVTTSTPQAPRVAPIQPSVMGRQKDLEIMRQTSGKCVAMSWQALPEGDRNMVGFIRACELWMNYFVNGPLPFGVQAFGSPAQGNGHDDYREAYTQSDSPSLPCPECGHTEGRHADGCPLGPPVETAR